MTAQEALEMGLINRVVPDAELREATRKWALEIAERGPLALAGIKSAFLARHGGVAGLGRVSHDLLLKLYLKTDESKELSASFGERRRIGRESGRERGGRSGEISGVPGSLKKKEQK